MNGVEEEKEGWLRCRRNERTELEDDDVRDGRCGRLKRREVKKLEEEVEEGWL